MGVPCGAWLERGLPWLEVAVPSRTDTPFPFGLWRTPVTVIIGMDPHKRSATLEIIDHRARRLTAVRSDVGSLVAS